MNNDLIFAVGIVLSSLIFSFLNGANDSANIIATLISSRSLSPPRAKIIAGIFEFSGACFLGTAVAKTMAWKIVLSPDITNLPHKGIVILSALLAALFWNILIAHRGIPASSFHALIGGMIGSFTLGWGLHSLQWRNIGGIFFILIISPLIGFFLSYVMTSIIYFCSRWFTPKINPLYKIFQLLASVFLAFSHGSNDGQKTMGIIIFSLVALGFYPLNSAIPLWIIISCAASIAFGIGFGQWQIIRNLSSRLYRIRTIHGLAAQSSSALVISGSALLGFPLSTTQVVSSAIAGSGALKRPKAIRWNIVGSFVFAWLVTMPGTALISGMIYYLLMGIRKFL